MKSLTLSPTHGFKSLRAGFPAIPGDKSISHRALILGTLAQGKTRVRGLLDSADVRSTRLCLEGLGAKIRDTGPTEIEIEGLGLRGLQSPRCELDCGNSGTTLRLLMGVLAAQKFNSVLIGDQSLAKRPMRRVADPLGMMGAAIELSRGDFAPIRITGSGGSARALLPLRYDLPIASAQIKSALLLAALYAEGESILGGKIRSRDHTERLLEFFGVPVRKENDALRIHGGDTIALRGASLQVPGDFSTAAFWIAAAAMVPGAHLELEHVSLNPTRMGFSRVLERMGARIETEIRENAPEPWGSLRVEQVPLNGTVVSPQEVPELIDELPLLAVLATQAEGVTEVHGARELRVKESDRIEALGAALRAMGAEVTLFEDGFSIRGPQRLRGAPITTHGDHRIAMAFSIAALIAEGSTEIDDPDCVAVSYPGFYRALEELCLG